LALTIRLYIAAISRSMSNSGSMHRTASSTSGETGGAVLAYGNDSGNIGTLLKATH